MVYDTIFPQTYFFVKWLNLLLRTFQVDHDYHYMFNATRYDIMMNVREELMNIAKENDKAYGMYRGKQYLNPYKYADAY